MTRDTLSNQRPQISQLLTCVMQSALEAVKVTKLWLLLPKVPRLAGEKGAHSFGTGNPRTQT